jgi:hypothetical protein
VQAREGEAMSYCRWSSGGYTTHVAANRPVITIPPEWDDGEEFDAGVWYERHKQVMQMLKGCKHELIGLPHDGETFNDPDLTSFYERVASLVAMGYNVPSHVLEDIRAEIDAQEQEAR